MSPEFLLKFRSTIITLLVGILLVTVGVIFYKAGPSLSPAKVEILEPAKFAEESQSEITVEISGQVVKPGVYSFKDGARVEEALKVSEGFTKDADTAWI